LIALPGVGRRFAGTAEVRLGDTGPAGQLRLDAIARMLQDLANDDARDAVLPNANSWVVRRTLIDVRRPATLGERLTLTTFCAGTGRSWAERRTSTTGDGGAKVEAASLWVQVDTASGRPQALGGEFHAIYGATAAGRVVSSRLALPGPTPGAVTHAWAVRTADLDVFGHVNNAVAWAVLEEALAGRGERTGVGEVEYPAPLDREPVTRLVDERIDGSVTTWLVTGDGTVRLVARWTPATPADQ